MTNQVFDQLRFTILAAAAVAVAGCGGAEDFGSDEAAENVGETQAAVVIGPSGHALDYIPCAQDFGTCVVGDNRYLAYGVNGNFLYKTSGFPTSNTIPCTPAFFGGDPAPGVVKTCYIANYALDVAEHASSSAVKNVAYGANGVFNFKTINGNYTCDNATFGDPLPGVVKACYQALPDYFMSASEGGTLTGLSKTPIAYGANGQFVYKIESGSVTCGVATFGTDPAFGVLKNCYKMSLPFLADEGGTVSLPSPKTIWYGSGLNGNFITSVLANGDPCTFTKFGGDPHFGVAKHCY